MEWNGIIGLISVATGMGLGFALRTVMAKMQAQSIERQASSRRTEADRDAKSIRREAEIQARAEVLRVREKFEQEVKEQRHNLESLRDNLTKREAGIVEREENLDRKASVLDRKEQTIDRKLDAAESKLAAVETREKDAARAAADASAQLQRLAGMTRDEVSAYIKQQLISQNLVNDPVVTVEYVNLKFSVMGEVKSPGSYSITRDRITLLDAISQAGDMTIYGKRDNVLILRPDSIGKLSAYHVDMRSFNDVVSSPAYYIHQNDYIYVEPNKKRANESTVNGNTVQSASFWISIVSLLASLASTTTLILTRAK